MNKKCVYIIIAIMLCVSITSSSATAEPMPTSSTNFLGCAIHFASSGTARFTANMEQPCASFSVQSCTLQKLSNSKWVFVQSLECPDGASSITHFAVTKDYSSCLTKGTTYRLVVVYNADGETATATSSQLTY